MTREINAYNRIKNLIKRYSGVEKDIPRHLIEELTSIPESYNVSIVVKNEKYFILFSFYKQDSMESLELPLLKSHIKLDTEGIMAFSVFCTVEMKIHKERCETFAKKIYDDIMHGITDGLTIGGTTVLTIKN